MILWRMQDGDGRGPFRPGFTREWIDAEGEALPAIFQDFDRSTLRAVFARQKLDRLHIGCACEPMQFGRWFTSRERVRLALLGYRIVDASGCRVLARSPHQVIIGSERPLASLPVIENVREGAG